MSELDARPRFDKLIHLIEGTSGYLKVQRGFCFEVNAHNIKCSVALNSGGNLKWRILGHNVDDALAINFFCTNGHLKQTEMELPI